MDEHYPDERGEDTTHGSIRNSVRDRERVELEPMGFLNTNLEQSVYAVSLTAKTLVCFVTDNTATSSQWESIIKDQRYRARLTAEAVTLKIIAGTQEAEYLHGVCPLNGTPAVIMVRNAAVKEDLQHPQISSTELRNRLDAMFVSDSDDQDYSLYEDRFNPHSHSPSWIPWFRKLAFFGWIVHFADEERVRRQINEEDDDGHVEGDDDHVRNPYIYITLPPSAGRMRLPNNAYDALGVQTQRWIDQGVRGDNILRLQLRLLRNIPALAEVVTSIETRAHGTVPELRPADQDRLLNTPAHMLGIDRLSAPTAPSPNPTTQTWTSSPSTQSQLANTAVNSRTQTVRRTTEPAPAPTTSSSPPLPAPADTSSNATRATTPTTNSTQNQQRTDYIRLQRERESAARAERDRIKAQIASDRADRRRAEEIRRQGERRAELDALRQSNSTSANPQTTDIRVQVRTFDGSTVKSTFKREATISNEVRPWLDEASQQKMPYNLKLIRTPLPNRNIEAGEEEQALSDLGLVGSATMVMVPVREYVESYSGGGGGLVRAVTGAVGGVLGGLGTLIGWGGGSQEVATATNAVNNVGGSLPRAQDSPQQPRGPPSSSSAEPRVRVRTLADQRAEEAQKQGNELYNGNQLNFQGRGDEKEKEKKDE